MKILVMCLVMALSTKSFAAAGDGVVMEENSSSTDISVPAGALISGSSGSMLFDLAVEDAVTYKLLNDGASSSGLDVVVDLGSISAGIPSAVDGSACSTLTGSTAVSALGVTRADTSVAAADCVVKKVGSVVSIRHAIPLRATLLKSGNKVFEVSYSRSGAIGTGSPAPAAFTKMHMKPRASLSDASVATGDYLSNTNDVLGAGPITMVDQDDIGYQAELQADLNGPTGNSHYSEAIRIDVTLN